MWGAEKFLASGKTSKPAAAGWLEALGQASLRWHESAEPDSTGDLATQTSELMMSLAGVTGYSKAGEWLFLAYALGGKPEPWRQGFAAGMGTVFGGASGSGRRRLLRVASDLLGRQGRADLAREIALAAFGANHAAPRHSELDQILEDLTSDGEQVQRIYELVALASAAGVKDKALNYVANSLQVAGSEQLKLLVLATLILTDGYGPVADLASSELADALESPGNGGPAVEALFKDVQVRNDELRARINGELESSRKDHKAQLKRKDGEIEQLHDQVEAFRALMASGREESRLEVRQDMLLAVGDVIQRAYNEGRSPEDRLRDVMSTLPKALREGGAETLGTVGDIVPYDPKFHHSPIGISRGTPVRLSAPGVIVRGRSSGDRVVLKANVKHQSEVS